MKYATQTLHFTQENYLQNGFEKIVFKINGLRKWESKRNCGDTWPKKAVQFFPNSIYLNKLHVSKSFWLTPLVGQNLSFYSLCHRIESASTLLQEYMYILHHRHIWIKNPPPTFSNRIAKTLQES